MERATFLEKRKRAKEDGRSLSPVSPDANASGISAARALHRRVREALGQLRRESGIAPSPSLAEHVREVIVIASSSRGGSSLLAEMLRSAPTLAHFPGEINPSLRLADVLVPCAPSGSDAVAPDDLTVEAQQVVDLELSAQCGSACPVLASPEQVDRFTLDLACRLTMQWPDEAFPLSDVRPWVEQALRDSDWRHDQPLDVVDFHTAFLAQVRQVHPQVDAQRYDLPEDRVGRPQAHLGPPVPSLIEEPPFVAIAPWSALSPHELATRPLVVKTPSNVYRLDALRLLFPHARLRILHLTRNAGAAINGLYDGWRHHGFFAHELDVDLAIPGYSEMGDWARHHWKFDLPPGWKEYATAPLAEVCAFQWRSAHRAVMAWLDAHREVDRFRVHFEDLVGPLPQRQAAWQALEAWVGVPLRPFVAPLIEHGLPPVMATRQPSRRRWTARADLIEPIVTTPEIRQTMERLGYDPDPRHWE